MKKFKVFLLTAMMLMSSVGMAVFGVSCAEDGNKDLKEPAVKNVVELNGFEDHVDIDTVWFKGLIGKMELNTTDKNYIREGNGSAKLTVESKPFKDAAPYLVQATNLTKKKADNTDFSFVRFVTLEVYNAQAEMKKIELQLVFPSGNGPRESFELAPNAWTTIKYAVDREYIPASKDEYDNEILKVSAINILFNRSETDDIFYLDDMRLYKTSMPAMPITMELDENEFCSFDKLWQSKIIEKTDWSYPSISPEFSYSTEITATGGGASFCMTAPAGDSTTKGSFAGMVFSTKQIEAFPWEAYDGNDRFCFDVYAPKEGGIKKLWFNMYGQTTTRYFVKELDITGGVWNSFSFTIDELNNQGTATIEDYFAKTKIINITYMADGETRTVYLDNFRVEIN